MQRDLSRQSLYDLVWSTPVKNLAPAYDISDVAFAKICKQHNIPLPPRGHWAKLAAGKKVYQQPLPPRALGMPREIKFGATKWQYYGPAPKNLINLELHEPPPFDESIDAVKKRVGRTIKPVKVGRDLSMAHPVVRKLLDTDSARREKYWASSYQSTYDAPFFDSPFEQRRLKALNALFLALEKLDARVTTSGKNPHDFSVRVGMSEVVVSIDDPKKERASWYATSELTKPATSPLVVKINRAAQHDQLQTHWQDSSDAKIETRLTDVAIAILVIGEDMSRSKEISHYRWLVKYKAELIERAKKEREDAERARHERLIKEEKARVDRLLSEAGALQQAEQIRAYVAAARLISADSADPVSEHDLTNWAKWALEQADRIDPVLSRRFLRYREEHEQTED